MTEQTWYFLGNNLIYWKILSDLVNMKPWNIWFYLSVTIIPDDDSCYIQLKNIVIVEWNVSKPIVFFYFQFPSASGVPVILLIFSAGPLDIRYAVSSPSILAILQCWFPAQATGEALYKVLSSKDGRVYSPAGRLPYTWPESMSQVIILGY